MPRAPGALAPRLLVLVPLLVPAAASAQPADAPVELPDIVVTAGRRPEPIGRTGSAISVVTREEIETFNPTSVVDALRNVPGLDVTETGGPGAVTTVRIRGANTGQTLVLLDGIRINDPSSAAGEFDFSNLLPTAIDRIEVLRGPQSALYGSDAIGGVVNILTRTGGGPPRFEARTEAGSYGALSSSATAFGSTGPWSYAFSGGGQKSAGFSRFGERVRAQENRFGRAFEADGFERFGGYGRIGVDAGEGVRLEAGIVSIRTKAQTDAAFGPFPDTPDRSDRTFTQIFGRAVAESGPLTHTLQVYANQTDREFKEVRFTRFPLASNFTRTDTEFRGDRVGTEYQGDFKLGGVGSVIFGGRFEAEKATTFSEPLLPVARGRSRTLDARQETRSVFALWQVPVGERVVLSVGGRHDETDRVAFDTFRATGAFLMPETGTKLRASGGTGGKAPTLFQLFAPTFGSPDLRPETSIGWDVGIDQALLGGRAAVSVTGFGNKFQDLIEFNSLAIRNNYFNVARAETSGIELEMRLDLVPDLLRLSGAYTYLHAKDERTGLTLPRRPEHAARIAVGVTPLPGWLVEPRVTVFSDRFSGANETGLLAPYARLDVYSEYKLDANWRVFARVENLLDQRYEEVLNYGTTGRAAYAGFGVSW